MICLEEKTIPFAKYISVGNSSELSYKNEFDQPVTISFDDMAMLKRKHRVNPVVSGFGKFKRWDPVSIEEVRVIARERGADLIVYNAHWKSYYLFRKTSSDRSSEHLNSLQSRHK